MKQDVRLVFRIKMIYLGIYLENHRISGDNLARKAESLMV